MGLPDDCDFEPTTITEELLQQKIKELQEEVRNWTDGYALLLCDKAKSWRPIDTAPRDCRILIGRVGHPWVFSAWWNERYQHWAVGNGAMDFIAEPTHWMIPPEAPNVELRGCTLHEILTER